MHQYNANRETLTLRAYGRNTQNIVRKLNAIEDKATRTKHAQSLLKVMAILDPATKTSAENLQKRWDDLHIIADYALDVDSPYPVPDKATLTQKGPRLAYQKVPLQFRNYGRNIERLVQQATETTDATLQTKLTLNLVRLMKHFGTTWNGDKVDSDTVIAHLQQLASSQLPIDREQIKASGIFQNSTKEKSRNNRSTRKRKKPA